MYTVYNNLNVQRRGRQTNERTALFWLDKLRKTGPIASADDGSTMSAGTTATPSLTVKKSHTQHHPRYTVVELCLRAEEILKRFVREGGSSFSSFSGIFFVFHEFFWIFSVVFSGSFEETHFVGQSDGSESGAVGVRDERKRLLPLAGEDSDG